MSVLEWLYFLKKLFAWLKGHQSKSRRVTERVREERKHDFPCAPQMTARACWAQPKLGTQKFTQVSRICEQSFYSILSFRREHTHNFHLVGYIRFWKQEVPSDICQKQIWKMLTSSLSTSSEAFALENPSLNPGLIITTLDKLLKPLEL